MRKQNLIPLLLILLPLAFGGCGSPEKAEPFTQLTCEVHVDELIRYLSNYNKDTIFNVALLKTKQFQNENKKDLIKHFGKAFEEIDSNAKLSVIFNTMDIKEHISSTSTNAEVLQSIDYRVSEEIENMLDVISKRIKNFGIEDARIKKGKVNCRFYIEVPGAIADNEELIRFLRKPGLLEFWETYENSEVYPYLLQTNEKIKELKSLAIKIESIDVNAEDSLGEKIITNEENSLLAEMDVDTTSGIDNLEDFQKQYPLFAVLNPSADQTGQLLPGPAVGLAHIKDTAQVDKYLKQAQVEGIFPRNLLFRWKANAVDSEGNYFRLIALRVTKENGLASLEGSSITKAHFDIESYFSNPEILFTLNSEGAKIWQRMTEENIGKSIAIVFDGYVLSYPNVINEIPNGRSSITGIESIEEAKNLANIINSGNMHVHFQITNIKQISGKSK